MNNDGSISLTRRSLLIASCICMGCAISGPLLAGVPMVRSESPEFYRLTVGDYEVTVLSDGKSPLAATKLLQGNPSVIAECPEQQLLWASGSTPPTTRFLVNTGDRLVLIDAGAGTLLGPHTGKLSGNLRAAGYRPEQVDEVYLTHMHADHIGGLMSGSQPTFPNAIIRADRRDTDYWLNEETMRDAPAAAKRFFEADRGFPVCLHRGGQARRHSRVLADLIPGIRARAGLRTYPGSHDVRGGKQGREASLVGRHRPCCCGAVRRPGRHNRIRRRPGRRPNRSTGASSLTRQRTGT